MVLRMVWVPISVAIVMVACGGSQSAKATTEEGPNPRSSTYTLAEAFAQLTYFRDTMCACADERCARYVMADARSWLQELTSMPAERRGWTFTKVDKDHMDELTAEMMRCGANVWGKTAATDQPPPIDQPPPNVTPTELHAHLISGEVKIYPDNADKGALARRGIERVVANIRLCVDKDGNVFDLKLLKSSGVPNYDGKIKNEMATWRYSPFTIGDRVSPVCSVVTFIYSQKNPQPVEPAPEP